MLFVKTNHCICWPLVGHFTVVHFHGCSPLQQKSCICSSGSSVWGDSTPCGFSKKSQIIKGNRASFESFWLWVCFEFPFFMFTIVTFICAKLFSQYSELFIPVISWLTPLFTQLQTLNTEKKRESNRVTVKNSLEQVTVPHFTFWIAYFHFLCLPSLHPSLSPHYLP